MLAFVLWRKPTPGMSREGEYKVAVNINYDSPDYKNWHWYNKKDTRMDNDLPLAVFPPALIQSIKDHVMVQARASGYLKDIDEDELNEKTYLLSINGEEGNRIFKFIPRPNTDSSWLSKYDPRGQFAWAYQNPDWSQIIPIITVREPNGRMNATQMSLTSIYRSLKNVNRWRQDYTPLQLFFNNVGYDMRNLSDEKKMEVYNFVKEHFRNNYKGFMDVQSDTLQIGDYVRWERRTRRDRNRLGRWRQGEIIRQTPSGYFVVNVEGEDKPARFKPSWDKYMGKRYEPDNLDMSVWDEPNTPVEERLRREQQ
jgi:hypothetical protein